MVNDDRWTKEWERARFRDDERRSREEGPRRGGGARVYRGREIDRGGRDHGGGYGAERYGRAYPDHDRRDEERRYGGNDYNRGFYGADQGYGSRRGSHQETREDQGERGGWERFSDEISSWFGDDVASRRRDHDTNQ